MRVGINHFEPLGNGSFRKLEPTYHELVQFGRGAELSHERFRRGDDIVAQGQVREYTRDVDGEQRSSEQFLARRIMHDPNTTTYHVERGPRAAERDSAERAAVVDAAAEAQTPSAALDLSQQSAHPRHGTAEPVSAPPPPPQTVTR